MNDSYSLQCVGVHACVCEEEEAAMDGDFVVMLQLRYILCCLLLGLFKNALEPTGETSIYICHRGEGGERGRHSHIRAFHICSSYKDRWNVSPLCSSFLFIYFSTLQ